MKVDGYSGYEIYPETGQVWSYKRNKFIGTKGKNGYWKVTLWTDNNVKKSWLLHRLVWFSVNGIIPEGLEINHNDENKNNNSIFNLSLVTRGQNINWGTRNVRTAKALLNYPLKSCPIIALQNEKIKMFFLSLKEAERNGFMSGSIWYCLKNKRPHHKGYQWKYLKDCLADILEEIQNEDMKSELLT